MAHTESAMTARQSWIGTIQIISAAVCWGTLGIFSTYLNQRGFSGWQITILRIVSAAFLVLVMLPTLWPHLIKLRPKQWLGLALQSLIGVLGMSLCYFVALLFFCRHLCRRWPCGCFAIYRTSV